MNAPKKDSGSSKKSEPEPRRYEAADVTPTSPVPSVAEPGKPFERPEGDLPVAVLDSNRMKNPVGLKALRAEAAAAE